MQSQWSHLVLIRGHVLHFVDDPARVGRFRALMAYQDGGLCIMDGHIFACRRWTDLLDELPHQIDLSADIWNQLKHLNDSRQSSTRLQKKWTIAPAAETGRTVQHIDYFDYGTCLVMPGLIDGHVHYAQTRVTGSYGCALLDWLNRYTFPEETRFADPEYAAASARHFIQQMVRHGTTTAAIFATVHPQSVDAILSAAQELQLRILSGKVMMDRHAPADLCDVAEQSAAESAALMERWHGVGRLRYCVTPRFAPTSTPLQLQLAGELYASRPDVHVQSHLAENHDEIDWVRQLYPAYEHYLGVYAAHGLIGPRSIFGHCLHLSEAEIHLMRDTGTAAAFCPSSNLFLGSGLFDFQRLHAAGIPIALATDVGGGTSLSLWRTLGDAYKVMQLQQQSLDAWQGIYQATLGAAKALYLDKFIGNFEPGKEADLVVIDPTGTTDLAWRLEGCDDLAEQLFAVMSMGDERCVVATHILGRCVYASDDRAIHANQARVQSTPECIA